jgi:fructose-1-phosphate kinase PfkB-like protein
VGAQALVVSGSLPARIDPAMPAKLARLARDRDLPVVLDLDDEPLRQAATERGAVLVPNLDELHRLVDRTEDLDVVRAARDLHSRTGAPVVVTLGADGMVAVTDDRCWHAVAPEPVRGNATGAGDAAVAAIVRGLVRGDDWPAVLADAVALSAAAVASPVAGDVDLAAYRAVRDRVSARPVNSYTTGRRQPR